LAEGFGNGKGFGEAGFSTGKIKTLAID